MTTQSRTLRDLPDIAPVRPGEQLPWDRLAAHLRPRLAEQGLDVTGELRILS
ncbi:MULTISPECIES: hypothetical protein [unclassified Frankia]|uniref:hypothetical protein n=1 Tax=unclassified Frankia TaxID=2632575 RepID=UPI002AD332B0|nr:MULTISPECIES: hypothetical protein [unclassified Frankia]